ncbi:MAG: DeoR/GlpR transcriptional regulator [Hyphomicrobiales bacterium]|nr:MAG: DeoR/GlpR transcriptional regulator [Hyphomicrobiales bacterium]
MHAEERERTILDAMAGRGFVTYRTLEANLSASPATIRRDLSRLEEQGKISRVRGGAKLVVDGIAPSTTTAVMSASTLALAGTPFDQAISRRLEQKEAIGLAAAALCRAGEGVMIDGGTTTYQMCPHLEGLNLQILSNSLHIVLALLTQRDTEQRKGTARFPAPVSRGVAHKPPLSHHAAATFKAASRGVMNEA